MPLIPISFKGPLYFCVVFQITTAFIETISTPCWELLSEFKLKSHGNCDHHLMGISGFGPKLLIFSVCSYIFCSPTLFTRLEFTCLLANPEIRFTGMNINPY